MKVKYKLSSDNPNSQYMTIEAIFQVTASETIVHLPTWRPGRYELGNFAKNVRHFQVFNSSKKRLDFKKIDKAQWSVVTNGEKEIKVVYQYYASELNAGSTFVSEEQIYVNPVNCFVFTDETVHSPVELELNIPEDFQIASNLSCENNILQADNYDQLADSPFLASPTLLHNQYEVNGVLFHLWFQGMSKIEWDKLIKDFTAFTAKQIEKFTEFPVKEYHFLFQIVPYHAYHGVEHCSSTVILLGPTYDVFGKLYKELLGVSSHELYHSWNVKAIRPIEMFPYNFKLENFSELGYLCEGVTTYMGDLFLYKSQVFNFDQYALEFNQQLQKHFDNHGRFNYSVAASSFDTWLDGYAAGAPGRKVSIYTEGCLLAFMTDVRIRKATSNKYGIDELMKRLYFNYALIGKGVSESDYFGELEQISGEDWSDWKKDLFHGTKGFEGPLTEALEYLGLDMLHKASPSYSEAFIGIKTVLVHAKTVITAIYPGSPADMAGLMIEDEIMALNEFSINQDLDKWMTYLDEDSKELTINRKGKVLKYKLPVLNRTFYNEYSIKKLEKPNSSQIKAFELWSK